MIKLSYSSLNILHTCPHNWLNKMMGIPQPDRVWFKEGRKAHRIIQDHISGKKPHEHLKHIDLTVPVVEETDFDIRCKFSFTIAGYLIRGYYDGLDLENNRFIEIKTSSSGNWSIGKFQKAPQRKIYGLSNDRFKESVLITGHRKPVKWKSNKLKVYIVPVTEEDREEARQWIEQGIKILESGDFTSDLVDGKCTDPYCYWGENCQFK